MTAIEWRAYEAGHCVHPECSTRRGGAWKKISFPALAFLLRHPALGWMLFDTGYSRHFFDATRHLPERLYRIAAPPHLGAQESLASQLARDGIHPHDIATVILSHLHGDHVGGLRDFPTARIVCSREAWLDLHARSRLAALKRGLLPGLLPADFEQRAQWIEDSRRVSLPGAFSEFDAGYDLWGDASMLAVPLPGHAIGHYGLTFRAPGDDQVFLVADATWSSRTLLDGIPPPALVTSWLGETQAYRSTLARLHRLRKADCHLRIIPSHCGEHRPR